MSKCERCGIEFQAYCGKCREVIRLQEAPALPSDSVIILLAYDPVTKLFRFGCTVKECPCHLGDTPWCSKAVPDFNRDMIARMIHDFDGDNCVKQWCG